MTQVLDPRAVEASTAEKSAQEKLHYQDVLKYLTERSYRAEAEKAMEEDDPKESERFHSQRCKPFTVEHALSCSCGGYPSIRHNELRDIPATLLTEHCLSSRHQRSQTAENGAIMANGNLKSSAVFKMYLKNSQIQFELKNKSGMFLMLKELNSSVNEDVNNTTSSPVNITAANPTISQEYAVVVYYPSESHLHVTMWENKYVARW
ncbi:hypothetical protein EMCRGX_G022896 [Ephydatia muelleri]